MNNFNCGHPRSPENTLTHKLKTRAPAQKCRQCCAARFRLLRAKRTLKRKEARLKWEAENPGWKEEQVKAAEERMAAYRERKFAASQRYVRPEEVKARRRKRSREFYAECKSRCLDHYSGGLRKCACCGNDYEPHLNLDHIDGGGHQHRKAVGDICIWLVRNHFPPGFQILCCNCNFAKHLLGRCGCQDDLSLLAHSGP